MARLKPASEEAVAATVGAAAPLNMRIWANRPELAQALQAFAPVVGVGSESHLLPARLHELVRLRIAFHNQCRSCMALRYLPEDEVPDGTVCSLERPREADDLTAAERLALEYADRLATNHLSIDDAFYDSLREHFSEPEIVELGANMALCIGFGRLESTWDMVDELPEYYARRDEVIAPWGSDGEPVRTPHA